ncbi:MAG TPA: 3-oxoacyl-ACP reductase [Nitriliruptoraceae bacterium]|nr:3-oxoacyl-ACP reductase [Nitriliruptoraceae bacterium]
MSDLYTRIATHDLGERVIDLVGLPKPAVLRRHEPGQAPLDGPVLVGGTGELASVARDVLGGVGLDVHHEPADPEDTPRYAGLVFDASDLATSGDLVALHDFFHTLVRRLGASGRIVVLGRPPATSENAAAETAQRSLEGFTRSLGKEMRAGGTVNLVEVAPGAASGLAAPLRFLMSGRSAFVAGQRLTVSAPSTGATPDLVRPHADTVAVVTGAARGIGEAIARTLARDGATVVCVDLPSAGDDLARVANDIGGSALQLDITDEDAGATIVDHVATRHGHADLVVHNAGVTRDKTMAGMDQQRWDMVLAINLTAIESINAVLLDGDVLGAAPRIVCVSSMSGIAGNRGQTNYATSKAGVIGHVAALADDMAAHDGTINAVAPGFIETEMTAQMPVATRQVGRMLNSLSQGGLPIDVAETIGFLGWSDADGINGTTLRVCGQNLLGA